jgi:protein-tyrosine phosphatase
MDFENLKADLVSEPIQGYLHDGRRIDIPLISHVIDNLYVGGHSDYAHLGDFFSHVFSLYVWGKPYQSHEDTVHQSVRMYDSANEDTSLVDEVVPAIVEALEAGGNVLVHCQAGINRSNLTAALVLRQWKGLTSREAIDMLREKRSPLVLANRGFEKYLLSLDNPEPRKDYPGNGEA